MYSCHGVYELNQQTYHDWGPIPVDDAIGHGPIHPDHILHVV